MTPHEETERVAVRDLQAWLDLYLAATWNAWVLEGRPREGWEWEVLLGAARVVLKFPGTFTLTPHSVDVLADVTAEYDRATRTAARAQS